MSRMDAFAALVFYRRCLVIWTVAMMALILVHYVVGGL